MDYPSREPYFAMRFLRLLTKAAVAMHIGADGCMLLMIVAGQEDACRYSRPVSFWNHQLSSLLGLRGADEHALRRIRERCVKAGWLQYRAGNKQLPASYFVTIPAAVSALPDSGSDESPHEYSAETAPIQQQKRQESGENPARIRQESGKNPAPSSPIPIPNPTPNTHPNADADGLQDGKSTGNDSDLWRFEVGAQAWVRTLKRAGCKIGPNNWRAWQGLIERSFGGSAEACATVAATVKPDERWPDQVEAVSKDTGKPDPVASKYANRPTRIAQAQP